MNGMTTRQLQVLIYNMIQAYGGGGGGSSDHGTLTGLGDDDHTQYMKKASNLSDVANASTARTNLGAAATSHTHLEADITDLQSYLLNVVEDTTPQLGGSLDAQGNNITDLADITFRTGATGGTIRTGTSAADKFVLQAYDVDGAAYKTVLELDAGNTPVLELDADFLQIVDDIDGTKQMTFNFSGATTGTATDITLTQTANRTITLPDATDTLVGKATTDTLTNKTINADNNTISNIALGAEATGAVNDLSDVTITTPADNEVLAYNSGTTSWINQTAAEAGLSVAGHTHTESDITDLGSYITDVVSDTTPQLGGNLDLNTFKISNAGTQIFESTDGATQQVAITEAQMWINGTKRAYADSTGFTVTGNIAVSGTVDGRDIATDGSTLDSHVANTSNPHSVDETDILPSQTGNSGKYLTTNGTTSSWAALAGGGDMSTATYDPATISEQVVGLTATQTLTNKTLTSPVLNTGVSGTAVLDEDNMASNSATQLATQQSIKAYVDSAIATAKSALYPVGSYYINETDSTNPGTLLGFGTWVAVSDKTIVGKGSGTFATAGSTGGSETKTLTTTELPAHTHTVTDAGHTHNLVNTLGGSGAQSGLVRDPSSPSVVSSSTFTESSTTGITIDSAGTGSSFSIMNPYIVAYIWKRTA